MWIILTNFELSKNHLIHLFYLILIITTDSNQRVQESADLTSILPSVEKGSTVYDGKGGTNNAFKGLFERLNSRNNIPPTREDEINSMDPKENDIGAADNEIENQNVEEEEDPFKDTKIGLDSENDDDEPFKNTKIGLDSEDDERKKQTKSEKKKKKKKKKGKKISENADEQVVDDNNLETGVESNTIVGTSDTPESTITEISNPEENPTEDIQGTAQNQNPGVEENPEDGRKKAISQFLQNINAARNNIPKTNENEINNNNPDEEKIGVDENPKEMELNLSPGLKTPGDVEPEEQTNLEENNKQTSEIIDEQVIDDNNLETGAQLNTIVGTSDTAESTITEISDPEKNPIENTEDMPHPLKPIEHLELSPLDKVEIVKIKGNPTNQSEAIRKQKKRAEFKEFMPQEAQARIYCTFLGNVLKMYKKVKKSFIGHFCHAIVFGTPIILKQHRVHLSQNMIDQLKSVQPYKQGSLVIVIMEYGNYKLWKHALRDTNNLKNNLIIDIIHTVVKYKIDGIQFSNLHPTKEGAKINSEMMNHLIAFFDALQKAAENRKHVLKIGINFDLDGLPIANSFTSFQNLNPLITWYSFKSISMVTCSSAYKDTGTSPLEGNMGFETTIQTLVKHINNNYEFDMRKLVVGIQLFPNKVKEIHPYTYEEFCSASKSTWHSWCAADTQDLKNKGMFLRGVQIGGVQLYYMHSDDYRCTCGCYSFPLIRALLRGLIKIKTPEECSVKTAHN